MRSPEVLLLALAAAAGGAAMSFPSEAGREITVTGRVSQVPWQHLILHVPGKTPEYFDLDDGGQIVVHVAGGLPAGARLRLQGRVIVADGTSKRPGERKRYEEPQLDVERVEVLEAATPSPLQDGGSPAPGPDAGPRAPSRSHK